jgi:hypothetical protein
MSDESTKRAAQEYLAAKLSDEGQVYEAKINAAAAIELAPVVWKRVRDLVILKCAEWNKVTQEQTFTCTETALGDLRVWCPARSLGMTIHYDFKKLLITVKNTGRRAHEKDVLLHIEGYSTDSGRDARLVRSDEPVNLDILLLNELRVLSGIGRQPSG